MVRHTIHSMQKNLRRDRSHYIILQPSFLPCVFRARVISPRLRDRRGSE